MAKPEKEKVATKGHCPTCGGFFSVTKKTFPGMAGYSATNEAINYRLQEHIRNDVGGQCSRSNLPPDSLE